MITRGSCSWCHTSNVLSGGPVYCTECGHRADVCRLDCDCGRCRDKLAAMREQLAVKRAAAAPAFPPDLVADLAKELRETADWLEERATVVERIGARGRSGETLDPAAVTEAARLRGRAKLLRVRVEILSR